MPVSGPPDQVIDRLLDVLLFVAASFGTIALVASLVRGGQTGWHLQHAVHVVAYVAVLGGLLVGRRIRRSVRVSILLAPVGLNAVGNLYWFGLAGSGMLALGAFCVLAAVLAGRRAGIVALLGSTLIVIAIGALLNSGLVPVLANPSTYLRSGCEWFAYGSVFVVFTVTTLLSVSVVQQALLRSARDLRQRSRELQAANAELEREVEDRRRMERQLAEREAKYRLLAEATRDVIFTQDMNLRITYVSPSATALFGYTPAEFTELQLRDILTPASLTRVDKSFARQARLAAKGQVRVPLLEHEYVRKDGSTFWGELHATFLLDEEGQPSGVQGVLRDITDRKRAEADRRQLEQQLRQTEKLQSIGELAGGIAHDFNNQLAGILGYADLLRREFGDEPRLREYAENIAAPARRAADLTAKLLAFARKGQYQLRPVDVHAIIREVVAILQRSIPKTIQIRLQLTAESALVAGDATQLENALLNVALNARDAMPDGGELTVSTALVGSVEDGAPRAASGPAPGQLLVRIRDTGQGMTEDTRRRVFEPFFTTKPAGQGTGMGLAAVYGTVHSHGGTVQVESTPDSGSLFSISLPLCAPAVDASKTSGQYQAVTGAGRVLVVDDEAAVCQLASQMLGRLGYDPVPCESAREAVRLYSEQWHQIDLVLLDLVLPEMSGRLVFEALLRVNPEVRVLLFSGYSADGEARELLERGAVGFLQKPFTVTELSRSVAAALDTGRRAPVKTDPSRLRETISSPPQQHPLRGQKSTR